MAETEDTNVDLLSKYRQPSATEPMQPDDGRYEYVAFEMGVQGRRERRLMLRFENGLISVLSYAYLMEIICTSQQYISLVYTNCVITLKGRGLDALLAMIQDERLRALQAYHPEIHHPPADNMPVIASIKRENPQDVIRTPKAENAARW